MKAVSEKPHADKWIYLDHLRNPQYWIDRDFIDYRNPKIGFKICQDTGYVTYDERPDLEAHYRKKYRKSVQPMNLVTCNRKIEYHKKFIGHLIKPGMNVLDVGCAFGANLNWLKGLGCQVKGYELTDGFVNYGRTVFGLDIVQEKEPNEPDNTYDLIILYHVLEHVPDPVRLLSILRKCLKPGGKLYVSVPVWFGALDEPGGDQTVDFEHLFHIDHIQVFSHQSVRNVIGLAGLDIESEDDQTYGETFILGKGDGKPRPIVKEDAQKIIKIMEVQKQAIELAQQKKFGEAAQVYPDFPDAYVFGSLSIQKDFPRMKAILEGGLQFCSQKGKILNQLGNLYAQWDQDRQKGEALYSNNVKKAEDYFLEFLKIKPNNDGALFHLGMIEFNYKDNPKKAIEYWTKLAEVNFMKAPEMAQWIGLAAGK